MLGAGGARQCPSAMRMLAASSSIRTVTFTYGGARHCDIRASRWRVRPDSRSRPCRRWGAHPTAVCAKGWRVRRTRRMDAPIDTILVHLEGASGCTEFTDDPYVYSQTLTSISVVDPSQPILAEIRGLYDIEIVLPVNAQLGEDSALQPECERPAIGGSPSQRTSHQPRSNAPFSVDGRTQIVWASVPGRLSLTRSRWSSQRSMTSQRPSDQLSRDRPSVR